MNFELLFDNMIAALQSGSGGKWTAHAVFTLIVSLTSVFGLSVLTFFVFKRKDMQPLKIKSPQLLTLFLMANITSIVLLMLIQLNS